MKLSETTISVLAFVPAAILVALGIHLSIADSGTWLSQSIWAFVALGVATTVVSLRERHVRRVARAGSDRTNDDMNPDVRMLGRVLDPDRRVIWWALRFKAALGDKFDLEQFGTVSRLEQMSLDLFDSWLKYGYRIMWSREDKEYVGLCDEFPSLSFLAAGREEALFGIEEVVFDVLCDMVKNGEEIPKAREFSKTQRSPTSRAAPTDKVLEQKIRDALVAACSPENVEVVLEETGPERIGGRVLSARFAGMGGAERQDLIWGELDKKLDERERSLVTFIITDTKEEYDVITSKKSRR